VTRSIYKKRGVPVWRIMV